MTRMGSLVLQIQQASRLFERMLDPALEELGLQSSDLPVLIAASLPHGATVGEVREAFGYPSATVSRIARRLELQGYLGRAHDMPDLRTVSLIATLPGRTAAKVGGARIADIERRISLRVGDQAVADAFAVLDAARRIRPPNRWD
jgi:DNA-binding MarR family transcriptional regulator